MKNTSSRLSSADLVVLSLLAEQPMHGYKIVAELEVREAEDWAPISRPQVYYSIKKLAKLKFIESTSDVGTASGPEKETYRLNSRGMKAMNEALSTKAWAEQRPPSPFMTWMALSSHLTAAKTKEIIDLRQNFLKRELQKEKKTLSEFDSDSGAMVIAGKLMVSLTIEMFESELRWLRAVENELPKARRKNVSI